MSNIRTIIRKQANCQLNSVAYVSKNLEALNLSLLINNERVGNLGINIVQIHL